MKISFIVPAYNEECWIGDCLRSIIELNDSWVHEIIVIDNGSTDGTAAMASSFRGVTVVSEHKKGVTRARQKGLEIATGELIATIDADTRVSKQWLATVKKNFTRKPGLVCLIGPYEYYDLVLWKKTLMGMLRYVFHLVKTLCGSKTGFAQGGNTVYDANTLRAAGGFNTSIDYYGEDLDVLMRLRNIGETFFDPSMKALTSARRMNAEGFWKVLFINKLNADWQKMTKKPLFTSREKDWR